MTNKPRRLSNGVKTALALLLVVGLLAGCKTTTFRKEERPPVLTPSEQRDRAIDDLFRTNLAVRKSERVLVFTDDKNPVIINEAQHVAKRGANFGTIIFVRYPHVGSSGAEPPKKLWEKAYGRKIVQEIGEKNLMDKLLQKKISETELAAVREIVRANTKDVVQVVIGMSWYSTTHTHFRSLLTGAAGARFASMPAFNPGLWQTAMSADWIQVAQRTNGLKGRLSQAVSARVRTARGTDLLLGLKGRQFVADTGLLNQPGRSGNLPAGEVFIVPIEGTSRGRMVIEPGVNSDIKGQATFEISEGRVGKILGETGYLSWLESIFYKYPEARTLAEFGVGTNEKATIGGDILESEKALGTIHIALGDNSTIGGKTAVPFHQDFLFERPTVDITFSNGKTEQILKDGKLLQ